MRKYEYDNLKCLMIFFVVFAHLLEAINGEIVKNIYVIIYFFHIPIFVFISGYFFKFNIKKIIKFFIIYFLFQTVYCLFDIYVIGENEIVQYIIPNWIMWYMMSLICWQLMTKVFETNKISEMKIFLGLCFIISIFSGYFFIEEIGYIFSVSRTITFFPYFLMGYYIKKIEKDESNKNNNLQKINKNIFLPICLIIIVSIIYIISNINQINPKWLYGVYAYGYKGYNIIFKILWIITSVCILIILKNIISKRKLNCISYIGKNTLIIYLLHGFIINIIRYKFNIFVYSEIVNIILAIALSILILLVLGGLLPFFINRFKNFLKKEKNIEITNE